MTPYNFCAAHLASCSTIRVHRQVGAAKLVHAFTAAVGRLAGLKQLGCCYKVFSEANHNRYQHSRGEAATNTSTAHQRRSQRRTAAAAIGKGPTSKTSEQAQHTKPVLLSFLLVHHYLVTPHPLTHPLLLAHTCCRRRLPVRPLGSPPCRAAAARGRWPAPPAHTAEPPGARTHRAGRAVPRLWSRPLLTRFRGLYRQEPWDLWLVSTPACLGAPAWLLSVVWSDAGAGTCC